MRAELYANLHTHSTHSDGGFTPTQMVDRAIMEGFHAIAITDHDTATAYPELKAAADAKGIECIFGVEFSSPCPEFGENWTFHINGFHFDPEYPEMKQYLYEMSLRESDQTRQLFERGQRLGTIPGGITWEEVVEFNKPITWLCNEQLWWFLLDRKLVKPEERQKYWEDNFAEHRDEIPPLYPFKSYREIIDLIHKAGGIAIYCHPYPPYGRPEHLDLLMEAGIDGVEVWHPGTPLEDQEYLYNKAIENGLYISGGSDHSGICGYPRATPKTLEICPPLSAGTTKLHYEEIRDRKLYRENKEVLVFKNAKPE